MRKNLFRLLAVLAFSCCASLWAQENRALGGRVVLSSQPSGALVVVDGIERGTTPITLFNIMPGRHHLKMKLSGYEDSDSFFSCSAGQFVEKNIVLAEQKALFLVKTDPAGCNVAIDGMSVGETPLLVTHLSAKDVYSVKLTKAGYQPKVISVKFSGSSPLVREEQMVLDSGVINLISDPAGAEVTVNGIVKGRTPLLVRDIPKGRAIVKFKLDGFKDEVRDLAMRAGDQLTLPVQMEALPGTLHLVSVPEGARFYVDDEARGRGPLVIPSLMPGTYTVRAEMPGYGTMERKVEIKSGKPAREEFMLSNIMGRVEIRTNPVGAAVVFDKRMLGYTKSKAEVDTSDVFTIENVQEGEHLLVLSKEGYSDVVLHPQVENSKTFQASIRMKRVFIPNTEIVTTRGRYQGILVSVNQHYVVLEVQLGITRSFPRSEIRKMTDITSSK